ncbi:hypothetical protein GF337_04050 [candidate division KSB1 bacterium]|nr:hypothetical protein [candidate division KSB1 bacterium]
MSYHQTIIKEMKTTGEKIIISILVLLSAAAITFAGEIPAPEEVLGFPVGADRRLADFDQIENYFHLLAENSNRVVIQELGRTHAGNMLFAAIISSASNLRQIEMYQEIQQLLADPRVITDEQADSLIQRGKTVVSINCSIHSTEVGPSQMSLLLAYELAISQAESVIDVLERIILILIPVHNPDGLNMVSDWYRKYVGTKYEGCRLPRLYHKYTGHDINRDWYMLTQPETRLTVERIYNEWHPQIVLDMHQFGKYAPRQFVPPYTDPIDPNIDPILVNQINALGRTIASEMTANGYRGIVTNHFFDAWSPSRAYVNYHGGVRILSETASCRIASPLYVNLNREANGKTREHLKKSLNYPALWLKGNWRLADIVDYNKAVAMSVLNYAARYSNVWLKNFHQVSKRAIEDREGPAAIIIPKNQRNKSLLFELLDILQRGQVEIHRAEESFSLAGQSFEEGSYFILLNQPYGAYAKTLLGRQDYPENVRGKAYDISGHSLPPLMGIEVIVANELPGIRLSEVKQTKSPKSDTANILAADYFSFSLMSNDAYKVINYLLSKDYQLFIKPGEDVRIVCKNGLSDSDRKKLMNEFYLDPLRSTIPRDLTELKQPRIGVYKSSIPSIDEGWTRYVLEEYGFRFVSILDSDIKSAGLWKLYDVIVLPRLSSKAINNGFSEADMPPPYCGGIGPRGKHNLRKFVESGGTLIAMDKSVDFAVSYFELPVQFEDVKKMTDFWMPGPILNMQLNQSHFVGMGAAENIAFIAHRVPIIKTVHQNAVARYADRDLLVSGGLHGGEKIAGRPLILEFEHHGGRILLFAFRPFFRAQTRASYRLVFNALLFSG